MLAQKRNVKITIEYDGTDYFGWQRQPNHVTVQQRIEEAIEAVTQIRTTLLGSGRTDTGVHAKGQVANFRTRSAIPVGKFPLALSANLPADIAVTGAEDVPLDFHAQYGAKSKTYRYRILNRHIRSPLYSRYSARVWPVLDIDHMQEAATHLIGERDFAAFQTEANSGRSSIRTVTRADLIESTPFIEFWIEANGFLYNMVRAIVGTLNLVGHHKIHANDFAQILRAGDRSQAGPTAPPQGLCLMEVRY